MTEATPQRTPPDPPPTGELPPGVTPYLLVMPSGGAAVPGAADWPGADGQPAWAIPVTIPAGTRGYAVFVPLVGGQVEPGAMPVDPVAFPVADAPPVPAPTEQPGTDAALVAPADAALVEPADAALVAPADAALVEPADADRARPAYSWPPAPVPTHGWEHPLPAARPTFLTRRWPAPAAARGWAVPAGVLAGALGTAVFVPLTRTGIGWVLGGLAVTVGVLVGVWRRLPGRKPTERWISLAWTVAALALLSVLTFRNAWWLVTFCVLGALACAALAIVGGRQVRSILFSLVATPFAALRGLPWVTRHAQVQGRDGSPIGLSRRFSWSIVVTAVVLAVFGALLTSADAAFSQVLTDLVPHIDGGAWFVWVFLFVAGGLIATAAVFTLSAPVDLSDMDNPGSGSIGLLDWALPIGGLVALFGGFVAVQFTVLFGGERHVLQTAGLSYADYARSGFWQLAAVTVLTLAVLAAVARWARRERPVDRVMLRVLLGLLCALSVVIVVSALYRMETYQKVYSFTGERIFVMGFELLLGTVFVLVMVAGIGGRGAWIPRATAVLGVLLLLSLAVLNPEDYAARRNILRYQETGKIDAWYLRALSADATPALAELPDAVRRCALSWIAPKLADPDPWYAWNLGRMQARDTLARVGPEAVGGRNDCRAADQFDLPKTR